MKERVDPPLRERTPPHGFFHRKDLGGGRTGWRRLRRCKLRRKERILMCWWWAPALAVPASRRL